MNPDIQRVIELQRLDSAAQDARRRIADEPDRLRALDARLEAARQRVAAAKQQLEASQAARRDVEREVTGLQSRLSKYRDQLMAVKTNIEYQAMQKEIEYAQNGIRTLEDKVLERMLEADELTAALKDAERELSAVQQAVDQDRKALAVEVADLKQAIERFGGERTTLVHDLDPKVFAMFESVASRRHGVAVAEARDGICSICHVRLRPQVFNTVRLNDEIVQCESCQRILYFVPNAQRPATPLSGSDHVARP
jgi:hypothetical protein